MRKHGFCDQLMGISSVRASAASGLEFVDPPTHPSTFRGTMWHTSQAKLHWGSMGFDVGHERVSRQGPRSPYTAPRTLIAFGWSLLYRLRTLRM